MRRLALLLLVATGLAACHGSRQHAALRKIRLAVHQDPIAFLPVRVAQTLGYDEEAGLAVETSEVAGGAKAIQALLGGSVDVAAASMSDAVPLALEGRDVRGFLVLYTRPTAVLAVAPSLERYDPHDPGSQRAHSGSHRTGFLEPSDPQLSSGLQWPVARRRQHRLGRDDGQLGGRTRTRHCRRRDPARECDSSIREAPARAVVPRGSPHTGRRAAGVWLRGVPGSRPARRGQVAARQSRHRAAPRASRHSRDAVGAGPSSAAGARHDSRGGADDGRGGRSGDSPDAGGALDGRTHAAWRARN